jgi:hypothetical protein
MRLGDLINENQELMDKLVKSGAMSFLVIQQSKMYAEVKQEMCNPCTITTAVNNVANNHDVNDTTVWRAVKKMGQEC